MFGAMEPTGMQQYYQIRVTGTDLQGLLKKQCILKYFKSLTFCFPRLIVTGDWAISCWPMGLYM
jgi:hypothetical protein